VYIIHIAYTRRPVFIVAAVLTIIIIIVIAIIITLALALLLATEGVWS
jgi:hypothetical protein